MRKLLSIVSVMVGLALSAQATIVATSSSKNGRSAVDSLLNTLANGDQFLIGTFSNVPAISLSSGSIANILANGGWTQFANSLTIGTIVGNGGKLLGDATDTSSAADAFNGLNTYVVIFNTSSAATATQIGIFRATGGSTPWVFPANAGLNTVTLDMDDSSVAAVGGVGSTSESPQRFILANVIPEPASIGLVACGIFGLVGYRRMRRLG